MPQQFLQRALGHHFAALHSRAGAEVDDVIRAAHRLLVVFDHDERVAARAQLLERSQ